MSLIKKDDPFTLSKDIKYYNLIVIQVSECTLKYLNYYSNLNRIVRIIIKIKKAASNIKYNFFV